MESLATELLHELKRSTQRWFAIALAELVILIAVLLAFLWYISLPVEETITTDQVIEEVSGSDCSQTVTIN